MCKQKEYCVDELTQSLSLSSLYEGIVSVFDINDDVRMNQLLAERKGYGHASKLIAIKIALLKLMPTLKGVIRKENGFLLQTDNAIIYLYKDLLDYNVYAHVYGGDDNA